MSNRLYEIDYQEFKIHFPETPEPTFLLLSNKCLVFQENILDYHFWLITIQNFSLQKMSLIIKQTEQIAMKRNTKRSAKML